MPGQRSRRRPRIHRRLGVLVSEWQMPPHSAGYRYLERVQLTCCRLWCLIAMKAAAVLLLCLGATAVSHATQGRPLARFIAAPNHGATSGDAANSAPDRPSLCSAARPCPTSLQPICHRPASTPPQAPDCATMHMCGRCTDGLAGSLDVAILSVAITSQSGQRRYSRFQ